MLKNMINCNLGNRYIHGSVFPQFQFAILKLEGERDDS